MAKEQWQGQQMAQDELAARLMLKNAGALNSKLRAALAPVAPQEDSPVHVLDQATAAVSFRIVDIEATGLSVFADELIEVAVYEYKGGRTTLLLDTLVRPERALPARITALTGISAEMLAAAAPMSERFTAIIEALSGDCLVAHNTHRDLGYLTQMAWRYDPHWTPPPALCTLKLSSTLLPDAPSHALFDLAERLHLPLPTHRARADALATVGLLAALLDRAAPPTLADAIALQQRKSKERPQARISPLVVETLPEGPGLYRFYAEADRLLYVGYSAEVRRRVREHLYRAFTPASLELCRRALRIEATATASELDAFVLEGEVIAGEKPLLNVRNCEHGRVRYFLLTQQGAVTLSAEPSQGQDAQALGPIVLKRGERNVLQAIRETFGLSARGDNKRSDAHPGVQAFVRFVRGSEPGDEIPPGTPKTDHAAILRELRQALFRAEAERLDTLRPFRSAAVVTAIHAPLSAYALAAGRPTLRFQTDHAKAAEQLAQWLDQKVAHDGALDLPGRRISAYVRAHPSRVCLQSAPELLFSLRQRQQNR